MKRFIKEWGLFILFIALFGLSRLFVWFPVQVEGHSMDPTLANGERLIVLKTTSIERFDIVVAKEGEKNIVKRIIGMPGDTISYDNDTLKVNGKKVDESYLAEYQKAYAKDKLQSVYSYNQYFQELAAQSKAFTTDSQGQETFSITVPKGQYLLLGDDRIVSKDSRQVGTFAKDQIIGEVKARIWPLSKISLISNQ
ncbi:signal peptidase I [Streptococcus ferus]|uniref:Signal peptidase I n=1 Tax=Streptococcus ferus TaxID=1345 RepID=A0A2X3W1B8_9STRE|nr:signal peptidase I [Streptococcus ferus]SQF41049.1 signal peptidase I [Streptococcus ferus]